MITTTYQIYHQNCNILIKIKDCGIECFIENYEETDYLENICYVETQECEGKSMVYI